MVQEPDPSEVFEMATPVSKPELVGHEREQQRRGAILGSSITSLVGPLAKRFVFETSSVTG